MQIKYIGPDGNERNREMEPGSRVSNVVPEGYVAILNGEQTTRDVELREGDEVEAVRKSGKAGGR